MRVHSRDLLAQFVDQVFLNDRPIGDFIEADEERSSVHVYADCWRGFASEKQALVGKVNIRFKSGLAAPLFPDLIQE